MDTEHMWTNYLNIPEHNITLKNRCAHVYHVFSYSSIRKVSRKPGVCVRLLQTRLVMPLSASKWFRVRHSSRWMRRLMLGLICCDWRHPVEICWNGNCWYMLRCDLVWFESVGNVQLSGASPFHTEPHALFADCHEARRRKQAGKPGTLKI